MAGRDRHVIDTNVAIVANRRNGESFKCANACARRLIEVRRSGHLLLDKDGLVVSEYRKHLEAKGQPGVGDAFFKWLFDNRYNKKYCTMVELQVKNGEYEAFPDHECLKAFDRADRKFVALVLADAKQATILQACDTKWWGWRDALANCGVEVEFVCEDEIRAKFDKKFG